MSEYSRFRAYTEHYVPDALVNDAFALFDVRRAFTNGKAVFTNEYVIAYDNGNVKIDPLMDLIQSKVASEAGKMGYSFVVMESRIGPNPPLREFAIADKNSYKAIVRAKEVSTEELSDTLFYKSVNFGAFTSMRYTEGEIGEKFIKNVDKLLVRVLDGLFSEENKSDVLALLRKSKPSYLQ